VFVQSMLIPSSNNMLMVDNEWVQNGNIYYYAYLNRKYMLKLKNNTYQKSNGS
jgi:hypothetical protein